MEVSRVPVPTMARRLNTILSHLFAYEEIAELPLRYNPKYHKLVPNKCSGPSIGNKSEDGDGGSDCCLDLEPGDSVVLNRNRGVGVVKAVHKDNTEEEAYYTVELVDTGREIQTTLEHIVTRVNAIL